MTTLRCSSVWAWPMGLTVAKWSNSMFRTSRPVCRQHFGTTWTKSWKVLSQHFLFKNIRYLVRHSDQTEANNQCCCKYQPAATVRFIILPFLFADKQFFFRPLVKVNPNARAIRGTDDSIVVKATRANLSGVAPAGDGGPMGSFLGPVTQQVKAQSQIVVPQQPMARYAVIPRPVSAVFPKRICKFQRTIFTL
jgi:hypothetical protein